MLYHDSVYDEKIKDIKLSDIKTWVHDALAFFNKLGHNLSVVQIWTDPIQIIYLLELPWYSATYYFRSMAPCTLQHTNLGQGPFPAPYNALFKVKGPSVY